MIHAALEIPRRSSYVPTFNHRRLIRLTRAMRAQRGARLLAGNADMDEVLRAKRQPPAGSASRAITIRGARERSLKNIDVEIPRDKLAVFTGLSGSGKSSLAFDTIYAEASAATSRSSRPMRASFSR
jgi:hypothetical protein